MIQREVLPELLDTLPNEDPAAVTSRAELRLINRLMGNHRWVERRVRQLPPSRRRVLELGAGDGLLSRRLIQRGLCAEGEVNALDLAPQPCDWPLGARWQQTDLFALPQLPEAEVVLANLFLHHFQKDQLAELGRRLPSACRVLIFSEPARRRLHLWQGRLLSVIMRLGHVTRHDMLISIRAGFLHHELPHALGLHGWQFKVSHTLLGAYRVCATR